MAQEAKHTPGPWLRDGNLVYALDERNSVNRFTARIDGGYMHHTRHERVRTPDEEVEANVRLMLAAPDLFHELYMQVRNCPVCKGEGVAVDVLDTLMSRPPYEKKPCTRCSSSRAALAKAEGEGK